MPKFGSHRQFCKYLHYVLYGQEEKRHKLQKIFIYPSD